MDDLIRGAAKFKDGSDAVRGQQDYRALASGELADPWELGEFFKALGPVLQLPPKEEENATRRRAHLVGTSRKRMVVLVSLAVVLVAGAALTPAVVRALYPEEPVPVELHGRWVAGTGRYAGRTFELSETTLRLGLNARELSYPIVGMRHRDSADATLFTIRYRDGESLLDFGIVVGPDSVARLRNVADVTWSRVP